MKKVKKFVEQFVDSTKVKIMRRKIYNGKNMKLLICIYDQINLKIISFGCRLKISTHIKIMKLFIL